MTGEQGRFDVSCALVKEGHCQVGSIRDRTTQVFSLRGRVVLGLASGIQPERLSLELGAERFEARFDSRLPIRRIVDFGR